MAVVIERKDSMALMLRYMLVCFAVLAFGPARFTTAEELTKTQKDFVARILGDWKIDAVYKDGEPYTGPPLNANGARVSPSGLLFLGQRGKDKDRAYRFEAVQDSDERIDLLLEIDSEKHFYVLKMESRQMWLITRLNGNSELPNDLKPAPGNFCISLRRLSNTPATK